MWVIIIIIIIIIIHVCSKPGLTEERCQVAVLCCTFYALHVELFI